MKMRSSKIIIKNITQKVMAKFGFGCRFHELRSWIHHKLEDIITKFVEKH